MDNIATADRAADLLPSRSFGYRLWMLRHAWTRSMEAAIAPLGLTHMQFFILRAIHHVASLGEVPSQARLSDGLRVDRMTVSQVVRTMEAKGLLARTVHPEDARAKGVALTAPGLEAMHRATSLVHGEQERFFGRLGPQGKAAFSDMLDTLLVHEIGADDMTLMAPCGETR